MMAFHLFIMATAGYAQDAIRIVDDVVRKVEAAGVPMSIAVAYAAKGAAIEANDPVTALAAYEHGLRVARESGNRFMEILIAPRIAALHARSGDPHTALASFERMLVSFGEATDIASISAWRASLVVLFAKQGQFEAAATLHGTYRDVIDASGVVKQLPDAVALSRDALGADAFDAAAERGASMSLRQASDYAIEQVHLSLRSLK
jgi:hypothetical protein